MEFVLEREAKERQVAGTRHKRGHQKRPLLPLDA
jgi:hypothetical protein